MSIAKMVEKIIADGKITKAEHLRFIKRVNQDKKIDPEESKQIKRLIDMINKGELKLV